MTHRFTALFSLIVLLGLPTGLVSAREKTAPTKKELRGKIWCRAEGKGVWVPCGKSEPKASADTPGHPDDRTDCCRWEIVEEYVDENGIYHSSEECECPAGCTSGC